MKKNTKNNGKSTKVIANANCESCSKLVARVKELETELFNMRKPKPFELKPSDSGKLEDATRDYKEAVALYMLKDGETLKFDSKKDFKEAKKVAKQNPRALNNLYKVYKVEGWSLERIAEEVGKLDKKITEYREKTKRCVERRSGLQMISGIERAKLREIEKEKKEKEKNEKVAENFRKQMKEKEERNNSKKSKKVAKKVATAPLKKVACKRK